MISERTVDQTGGWAWAAPARPAQAATASTAVTTRRHLASSQSDKAQAPPRFEILLCANYGGLETRDRAALYHSVAAACPPTCRLKRKSMSSWSPLALTQDRTQSKNKTGTRSEFVPVRNDVPGGKNVGEFLPSGVEKAGGAGGEGLIEHLRKRIRVLDQVPVSLAFPPAPDTGPLPRPACSLLAIPSSLSSPGLTGRSSTPVALSEIWPRQSSQD